MDYETVLVQLRVVKVNEVLHWNNATFEVFDVEAPCISKDAVLASI